MPKLDRRRSMGAMGGSVTLSSRAGGLAEAAAQQNVTVPRKCRLNYSDDGGGAYVLDQPLTPRPFVDAPLGQIVGPVPKKQKTVNGPATGKGG
jgi:hypothetical protein